MQKCALIRNCIAASTTTTNWQRLRCDKHAVDKVPIPIHPCCFYTRHNHSAASVVPPLCASSMGLESETFTRALCGPKYPVGSQLAGNQCNQLSRIVSTKCCLSDNMWLLDDGFTQQDGQQCVCGGRELAEQERATRAFVDGCAACIARIPLCWLARLALCTGSISHVHTSLLSGPLLGNIHWLKVVGVFFF